MTRKVRKVETLQVKTFGNLGLMDLLFMDAQEVASMVSTAWYDRSQRDTLRRWVAENDWLVARLAEDSARCTMGYASPFYAMCLQLNLSLTQTRPGEFSITGRIKKEGS